jgi:uncharacterized membrane protein
MDSRAKIAGHPVHPMLIVFPLGLLATSLVFDVAAKVTGTTGLALASYYMIPAGVIGGLAAAVFGVVDWLAIPKATRARGIGAIHGVGNVVVVALFVLSWVLRRDDALHPGSVSVVLSLIGVLLALVTGWLGGELAYRLGIGVDAGAHPDAPSSLSGRPASERWSGTRPLAPRKA